MPEHNDNPITVFAKTNFRNQERVFGIKADDRRRHMYLLGKTGMGKTNLLENLAIQDIQQGHGICFIDPHGDVALKLIKAIPPERINDVIYFDPADQAFPIAFNVLEQVGADQRSLVASGLVGVFKKIWADSWGPRLEYILRNAILALLEYPGSSLLGVMRILVDKSYRERVTEKVTDPVVKQFWTVEFAGWNERTLQEVISPIQNKVGQFTSNSLIRNIIGQPTSAFDVRDIMDNKKILIMNLAKGKIGEDSSALLGAMMITKIQLAAMGRADIPEEDRKDFYLYVDEFQNFATDSFANILSEARKYRLSLILANQYIMQLEEKVSDAVFGNCGTIVSFRVGAADAELLEKEFEPVFMMNDLVNLPKYQIYLKLMIDGIAGDAFSATTLPPIIVETPGINEKVIAVTRERYAASQAEVEEKIRRWTGMLTDEEKAALREPTITRPKPTEPAPAREPKREVPKPVPARPAAKPQPKPTPAPVLPRPPVVKIAPVAEPEEEERVEETAPVAPRVVAPAPPKSVKTQSVVPKPAPKPVVVIPEPVEEIPAEEVFEEESVAEAVPEKVLYPAVCATCGIEIEVPFPPDPSRPTFCKDCLRDYQRAVAKEKQAIAAKSPDVASSKNDQPTVSRERRPNTAQVRSYASSERPMKLSQVQHIEPKKFKALRRKPDINVDAVRAIIDGARQTKDSNNE
ncbi:MAG: CxxC-x17-CxxC domain-containing protein [Undibacterium sp.]